MTGTLDAAGWVARWHTVSTPIMGATAQTIQRLKDQIDRVSPNQLAKLAAQDPMLAAHLLRAVNNRRKSGVAAEVVSLEAAVALLGTRRFVEQMGQLPTIEQRYGQQPAAMAQVLQQILRCRMAAELAFDWSVARVDVKPDEVEVAALLHNLAGCLMLHHEPAVQKGWQPWFDAPLDDPKLQQEKLGCTLTALNQALFAKWSLPALLTELNDVKQRANLRASVVQCACLLVRHIEAGWQHPALPDDLAMVAGMLKIEPDQVLARIQRVLLALARTWPYPQCPTPANWLPMLPGAWPRPQPARGVPPTPAAAPIPPPNVPSQAVAEPIKPSKAIYEEVVKQIRSHLDGTLTFNEMMGLVIRGMHDGIGLARVVFALMAGGQRQVKARYVIGATNQEPLARFAFDLDQPHLLYKLMQKTSGVWLSSANQAQLEPMLPAAMRQCIGNGDFFVMSIFVHNKPVGLLYADRRSTTNQLDEASYQAFKQLAMLAGEGLGHLAGKSM
ncbi:HD-like signal output (HDOD) protein [Chitinivorax tropicus]|uniref:HD-like signal output (HDOD) protein n=1 Tax=Chitinivorax tropicus TaxID=714531 RepID=A0A840MMA8_9PROT|nr:HDOD domain-containing protein [Chitinivorax tropicus]MBB5019550.1 HD-like signal output (HDOD) protein [Chitinivorax tropicus]